MIHHVIDGERNLVGKVSGYLGSSPGFVADVLREIRRYIDNELKQSTAKQDACSDIRKQNTTGAWFELSEISSAMKLQADGIQTLITLMGSSGKGEAIDGFGEGLSMLLDPIRSGLYRVSSEIDKAVDELRNLSQ